MYFFLGFTCLGTSGEPIKDIMRYSKLDNTLEVMKKTLLWRNIAPTCPDTIPCTPCTDTDPFIIYNCPAIYFCGNCPEFATDLYEGTVYNLKINIELQAIGLTLYFFFPGENGQRTRLVCVPNFCDSMTVALINLANLECYSMKFS